MSGEGLSSPGDEVDTFFCNPRYIVRANPEFLYWEISIMRLNEV